MKTILIVEDDVNINNLLNEALGKEGYLCEQAFSGTEARLLLHMNENKYVLVLLDLMLPGISYLRISNQVKHPEEINPAKVFDRFYKADEARSGNSTGLGLSIAKELVLRMDGTIDAQLDCCQFSIIISFPID